MNQGKTVADGEKGIDAILEQMRTQPVDAKELEKAKNQIISNFILGRDSDQERADALGRYAVLGKDPGLINRSPTEAGWIARLKPKNPAEAESLMDRPQYEEWVKGGGHGSTGSP